MKKIKGDPNLSKHQRYRHAIKKDPIACEEFLKKEKERKKRARDDKKAED